MRCRDMNASIKEFTLAFELNGDSRVNVHGDVENDQWMIVFNVMIYVWQVCHRGGNHFAWSSIELNRAPIENAKDSNRSNPLRVYVCSCHYTGSGEAPRLTPHYLLLLKREDRLCESSRASSTKRHTHLLSLQHVDRKTWISFATELSDRSTTGTRWTNTEECRSPMGSMLQVSVADRRVRRSLLAIWSDVLRSVSTRIDLQ